MKEKGKVISVSSVKGGVGKTTLLLNLAGIYQMLKKKILVIDFDLYSGGVSTLLDIRNKKDIFMLIDSISNNRFTNISDYVSHYNSSIDVLASPRDPRLATKIESKYIPLVLELSRKEYDVILVDTNHTLDANNLMIFDNSFMTLFVITNDLVDLKNMKSLMSIFSDLDKKNYMVVLNNSRDIGKDFLSMYDIRNIIKCNVDYVISKNFYIKNIDKYALRGEILTLNKKIVNFHLRDYDIMKKLALDLIKIDMKKVGEEHE